MADNLRQGGGQFGSGVGGKDLHAPPGPNRRRVLMRFCLKEKCAADGTLPRGISAEGTNAIPRILCLRERQVGPK